jgi:protein tyrosine phosphatase
MKFKLDDILFKSNVIDSSLTSGGGGRGYLNATYKVSRFDNSSDHFQEVRHIWFSGWKDFSTPEQYFDDTVMQLVDAAVTAIRRNETVVVSCKSGR